LVKVDFESCVTKKLSHESYVVVPHVIPWSRWFRIGASIKNPTKLV
jgi:hypothetical protein